jgi:hypothetical protein
MRRPPLRQSHADDLHRLGRVPEKRLVFAVLGLLTVQGMLVHVGQWFGLWTIAALHPVNALVLTYAAFTLAKRSNAYWSEATREVTASLVAAPGAMSPNISTTI